jgi:hypothetical protein
MFAAQPECLKKTLAHGSNVDLKFANAVIDHCSINGWVWRRLVLNDFKRPDASPLFAPAANEQVPVARRSQQHCAGRRQVCSRVKIPGDSNGVLEHYGIYVIAMVDVDSTH